MISYSLCMLMAVVAGTLLARRTQQPLPLAADEKLGIGLGALVGAMVGAKLPFLFSDWASLLSGSAWFANGKTILTGLAGGYLGVELAKRSLGIRVRTGDTFVIPAVAMISIGRVACFVGGCCYGAPTDLPWGVVFSHVDQLPRHPTQLYEVVFHLSAGALLAWLMANQWQGGQLMKIYIVLYAVYRFASEYLRPEEVIGVGLTGYQWGSLILAVGFSWLWWHDYRVLVRAEVNKAGA